MSLFEYIVLAISLGLEMMIVVKACAEKNPIRLTRGLMNSAIIAVIQTLLLVSGLLIGNALHFGYENADQLVFLGLMCVVMIRLLLRTFRKDRNIPPFNISQVGTVALLAIASGINVLLIGIAQGFLFFYGDCWVKAAIPLAVVLFLFSFLGLMLGRQHVKIKVRRWALFEVLFLLVLSIKWAFFGME